MQIQKQPKNQLPIRLLTQIVLTLIIPVAQSGQASEMDSNSREQIRQSIHTQYTEAIQANEAFKKTTMSQQFAQKATRGVIDASDESLFRSTLINLVYHKIHSLTNFVIDPNLTIELRINSVIKLIQLCRNLIYTDKCKNSYNRIAEQQGKIESNYSFNFVRLWTNFHPTLGLVHESHTF